MFVLLRPAPRPQVTVSFLGYTNDGGSNYGLFSIDNKSPATIRYNVGLPQIKTNGLWPRPHITANDGATPPAAILKAAGHATFSLEAPSDGNEWRAPVLWWVQGKENSTLRGMLSRNFIVLKLWWTHKNQWPFPGVSLRGDIQAEASYSAAIKR